VFECHGRAAKVAARVAVAVVCAACEAATWHVAPDGTVQGDGSREKPVNIAGIPRERLKPGDEVVFLDGVYKGALNIASVGNEKGPIVYRAENRHRAILDGSMPVKEWKKVAGTPDTWECRVAAAPNGFIVNGDGLANVGSRWRRDGKTTFEQGMFAVEEAKDDATTLDEKKTGVFVRFRPWGGAEPKEVHAVHAGTLIELGGAFNVVDGFLLRRAGTGVHVAGRAVHVPKLEGGIYLDISGLVHNSFGSYNILRNCVVRDMVGSALTSNESRFNLIEGCIIANAGMGQGDHGIYVSQGAENLVLRRNIWWRISGGAIHVYSGSGIDSPRNIVAERNVFALDRRNRAYPLTNRKSCAFYVWGGSRWAGGNRIVGNLVLGGHDRALSLHKCHFNLIAHNTFLGSDGAPIQIGASYGNVVANNILEYSPGGQEPGCQEHPEGYIAMREDEGGVRASRFSNNLLLPRGGKGTEVPAWMEGSRIAPADPFVDRAKLDFRLRPGSAAIDLGIRLPGLVEKPAGKAPDAGALELGDELYGDEGRFPEIPKWLLDEWPLSSRGR